MPASRFCDQRRSDRAGDRFDNNPQKKLLLHAIIYRRALACLLMAGTANAASVGCVGCALIRRLNALEPLYWIAHLGLSAADIRAIKKTCNIK